MRSAGVLTIASSDYEVASAFQRLPNKRSLPDYFDIIKVPMAFSTIRVSRFATPIGSQTC